MEWCGEGPFSISGKAIAHVTVNSELSIVTVLPNSYGVNTSGTACAVNAFSAEVGSARVRVKEVRVEESESIPLPEAEYFSFDS